MTSFKETDLPYPLASRFDLLWLIRDDTEKSTDTKIATHILQDQPHLSIAHLPDDRKALLRQQVEQMTSFSVQDRNNILAELDMPAKKAQVNKLTRLVNTWQLTRHQNIWETIGWRPNEENTNNG